MTCGSLIYDCSAYVMAQADDELQKMLSIMSTQNVGNVDDGRELATTAVVSP